MTGLQFSLDEHPETLLFYKRHLSPERTEEPCNLFFFAFSILILAEIQNEQADLILSLLCNCNKSVISCCYYPKSLTLRMENMVNPIKTLKWKYTTMSEQSKLKQYVLSTALNSCFIHSTDKLRNKSILCFPILLCKGLKALYSCKLRNTAAAGGEGSHHLADGEVKIWRGELT